jgi:hypothetical protein
MLDSRLVEELAANIGVEARALRAVIAVEAGGAGIIAGRPVIRLEVHKLWTGVSRSLRREVDQSFRVRGPRPWEGHEVKMSGLWTDMHTPGKVGQDIEWFALELASHIDREVAVSSTSWGAGQIMGQHWRVLGYSTVEDFVTAMQTDAGQLRAMVAFIKDVASVDGALRSKDWRTFARHYNGSGQVDWYANRLAAAYERATTG